MVVPVLFAVLAAEPAGAAAPTCNTVSVRLLDSTLGIDAAHVNAIHPASPAGALICSYYGNSGRAANEATINYLRASARTFSAVEASLAKTHAIRSIVGIKSGAYSYVTGSERFLYVLDGTDQVQMYAIVGLGKLEKLARLIPLLT
jgi:hypothetical protein